MRDVRSSEMSFFWFILFLYFLWARWNYLISIVVCLIPAMKRVVAFRAEMPYRASFDLSGDEVFLAGNGDNVSLQTQTFCGVS